MCSPVALMKNQKESERAKRVSVLSFLLVVSVGGWSLVFLRRGCGDFRNLFQGRVLFIARYDRNFTYGDTIGKLIRGLGTRRSIIV